MQFIPKPYILITMLIKLQEIYMSDVLLINNKDGK